MITTSRHNKYSSIPDWFSAQSNETPHLKEKYTSTTTIIQSNNNSNVSIPPSINIEVDDKTIKSIDGVLSVPIDNKKIIVRDGYLTTSDQTGVWELKQLTDGTNYIYTTYPVVTQLGVTMYSGTEGLDIENIYSGIPVDEISITKDSDGKLMINPNYELGSIPDLTEYASKQDLSELSTKVDDFLEGSNTNGIIDKWKELEVFLEGLNYSPDLAQILSTKSDKETTFTKDEVLTELKKYITINGSEDINGIHNFINGLKIGSTKLYNQDNTLFINGNLVVSGGITMYDTDTDASYSTNDVASQYSDIRKKTRVEDVQFTAKQIAEAPLIRYYYNSDKKKITHIGSIAQYWVEMMQNDSICKKDENGFYTMEIQNAALASAISIAREFIQYKCETDREISELKNKIQQLEERINIV